MSVNDANVQKTIESSLISSYQNVSICFIDKIKA